VIRCVEPELLDHLPARDPRALRSRNDLIRLNAIMGHARRLAAELRREFPPGQSFRVVELGAGDGDFLLAVARRLRGRWREVDAILVDLKDVLRPETRECFAELNWRARLATSDALDWLRGTADGPPEAIVANLFLHQFDDTPLRELLSAAANRTNRFIAVEPRRSRSALFFSRCLWFVGCNAVTRHDAPVSVRAGFAGRELSALWPEPEQWELTERPVGCFSHLFIARRKTPPNAGWFQPIIPAVFERPSRAPQTRS